MLTDQLTAEGLAQATIHMRDLALMGSPALDTAEATLRRRQLGVQTSELLVGSLLTVTDLRVRTDPAPLPPIYAYDSFNEAVLISESERAALDGELRTYRGSNVRWLPRQVWFRSKSRHTGLVLDIDTKNASIVMAGRSRSKLAENVGLATRWWVSCADRNGEPLVSLHLPNKA